MTRRSRRKAQPDTEGIKVQPPSVQLRSPPDVIWGGADSMLSIQTGKFCRVARISDKSRRTALQLVRSVGCVKRGTAVSTAGKYSNRCGLDGTGAHFWGR